MRAQIMRRPISTSPSIGRNDVFALSGTYGQSRRTTTGSQQRRRVRPHCSRHFKAGQTRFIDHQLTVRDQNSGQEGLFRQFARTNRNTDFSEKLSDSNYVWVAEHDSDTNNERIQSFTTQSITRWMRSTAPPLYKLCGRLKLTYQDSPSRMTILSLLT